MRRGWGPAAVLLAKVLASIAALATGFRAVSDDDYARVVIAEEWARAPKLDASGTSWLPLPFWVTGAAERLFGRSLEVARGVSFALGLLAALAMYRAARWLGLGRTGAVIGAVVAAVFPWSARLGVATVPELPAAALALLGIAALAPCPAEEMAPRRLWGAVALLAASLSRYEAWPLLTVFAVACLGDAIRERAVRGWMVLAAGIAFAGVAGWMLQNHLAHGDALHFITRVRAYRQALADKGEPTGILSYAEAMVRQEPEIFAALGAGLAVVGLSGGRAALGSAFRGMRRPAAAVLFQAMALSSAMVGDGAPTHHPERAMLLALAFASVAFGSLAATALAASPRRPAQLALLVAAPLLVAVLVRPRLPPTTFASRGDEEAIGEAARALTAPGEPVLLEVVDYGFLAVQAGAGRPEDLVADRSIDPRLPKVESSFDDAGRLAARAGEIHARWIIGRTNAPAAATLGDPRATRGGLALWAAPSKSSP